MIAVVDYGMGNVGSILNMMKKIGVPCLAAGSPRDLESADKFILPGVGAFDAGIRNLRERNYIPALNEAVLVKRKPLLGICLGMQLLTRKSEEGVESGLGWIGADTVRFPLLGGGGPLRIPHMGWNRVEPVRESPLFKGDAPLKFYFAHSYYVCCDREEDVAARTVYGEAFASSVQHGHIFGVQFHPEKSHRYGMRLLKNFAEIR